MGMEVWVWKYGMEVWVWKYGNGSMGMEVWEWKYGYGSVEIEVWEWKYGNGKMKMKVGMERAKPQQMVSHNQRAQLLGNIQLSKCSPQLQQ